jgi:hypothetical protein
MGGWERGDIYELVRNFARRSLAVECCAPCVGWRGRQGLCDYESLLGQRHKNILFIGLAIKGLLECPRRFSFAEMKGGLAQSARRGTYKKRIWRRHTGTPEKCCSSGVNPTLFPTSEIDQRQIFLSTRRAAGNGQRGRLANSREPRGIRLFGLWRLI